MPGTPCDRGIRFRYLGRGAGQREETENPGDEGHQKKEERVI
jgi:hypothetical protein